MLSARLMTEGFGEMGFSGSRWPDKKDTLAPFDKTTGCQFPDIGGINGGIKIKIKSFYGFFWTQTGV